LEKETAGVYSDIIPKDYIEEWKELLDYSRLILNQQTAGIPSSEF
jgi:hypothetical protein